jgi:hypothetical protein
MKRIKLFVIGIAVVALMPPMLETVHARGERSGGWSSGRGGGGNREYHGGGDEHRGDYNRGRDDRNWNDRYDHHDGVWGWGAADAAVAGVIASEAVQPATVIVDQSSASDAQPGPSNQPPFGTQVTVLPPGSVSQNVNGVVAYQCGNAWYKPYFGSNGVYYEVVPSPLTGN